ncbi:MAG: FAD-binding oxidoreductase [Alphaproteobacteria bacterium]|nr:FAD-binding oxidoreductase [Alphaproteobacteria bacterium]MDA8013850.1 FAD-binding oxidoreductase [Alphaproteobacteria bacterium]
MAEIRETSATSATIAPAAAGRADGARLRGTRAVARGEEHVASWYAATTPPRTFRRFEGSERVEVCVIGGGLTGVATTLALSEAGIETVLLESNRIGWGASGRNGGQICSFFPCGDAPFVRDLGADGARRVFDLTERAKETIADVVSRYDLDCDLRWGYYNGCEGPRQMSEARRLGEMYRRYGCGSARMVESREESCEFVNTPRYIGGLFEETGGHIHPLRYCLGMAEAASGLGALIYEGSVVLGWRVLSGGQVQVYTPRGDVVADKLVVACNAYQGFGVPRINRAIMPVGSFIVVTEPLPGITEIFPRDVAVCTLKHLGEYYRRTSDGRVLFGARANYSGRESVRNFDEKIALAMRRMFPSLGGVKIEYSWGGTLAVTARRAPHVGGLGGSVYFSHGYSGSGVLLTQMYGRALAGVIGGDGGDFELLSRVRAIPFPGGGLLRGAVLTATGLYFRLDDLRK